MSFFGDFGAKKAVFLVMAAPKNWITCSKTLQTRFFESSTLIIGWEALQLPTQAPKTLFEAKRWLFLAIFGQKMGFFLVMAAPKHSTTCTKTWQNTLLRVQHPQNRVGGPTSDHSGPTNIFLGQKLAFFGHFFG